MEGKMKTAVMLGIGEMGFEERDIPQVKDDEVLVKLEYVGICGSDLHYYETGAIGDYVVEPPFVLGHEPGGTVVEVGKNVTHLKAGDRVALEPGKTCGHCEFCKTGRYNLCPDVVFFATPPVDGVFQEYVAHEAGDGRDDTRRAVSGRTSGTMERAEHFRAFCLPCHKDIAKVEGGKKRRSGSFSCRSSRDFP